MTAKDILSKLNEMDRQLYAIQNDNKLSDIGRQEKMKSIRAEYDAYHDIAARELTKSLSELRTKRADTKSKIKELHQAESNSWNYDKLRYYREVAGDELRRAYNLDEAEKLINKAVDYGSREEQRAYLESTDAIQVRFTGDMRRATVINSMKRRANELTRPDGIDKLEMEEQKIDRDIVELYGDANKILDKYPSEVIGSPIIPLIQSIKITTKMRDDGSDFDYIINFADEP